MQAFHYTDKIVSPAVAYITFHQISSVNTSYNKPSGSWEKRGPNETWNSTLIIPLFFFLSLSLFLLQTMRLSFVRTRLIKVHCTQTYKTNFISSVRVNQLSCLFSINSTFQRLLEKLTAFSNKQSMEEISMGINRASKKILSSTIGSSIPSQYRT